MSRWKWIMELRKRLRAALGLATFPGQGAIATGAIARGWVRVCAGWNLHRSRGTGGFWRPSAFEGSQFGVEGFFFSPLGLSAS
jgi:hypothetical protein